MSGTARFDLAVRAASANPLRRRLCFAQPSLKGLYHRAFFHVSINRLTGPYHPLEPAASERGLLTIHRADLGAGITISPHRVDERRASLSNMSSSPTCFIIHRLVRRALADRATFGKPVHSGMWFELSGDPEADTVHRHPDLQRSAIGRRRTTRLLTMVDLVAPDDFIAAAWSVSVGSHLARRTGLREPRNLSAFVKDLGTRFKSRIQKGRFRIGFCDHAGLFRRMPSLARAAFRGAGALPLLFHSCAVARTRCCVAW